MPVVANEAMAYGYEAENRHFVRAFLGKEKPLLTFDDGLEVVKVLMTAYKSAETGKTLDFPPRGLEGFVRRWPGGRGGLSVQPFRPDLRGHPPLRQCHAGHRSRSWENQLERLPARMARTPSSTISVSAPAWPSKVESAGGPPLQASIHSSYTPFDRA